MSAQAGFARPVQAAVDTLGAAERSSTPNTLRCPSFRKKATAAVDKAAMRELMGAFDDNAIEMLNMFSDMTAPLIKRIQKAQDQNDFHDLKEAAHSLKGAARSACCNILGDMASELQDNAERKKASVELVQRDCRGIRARGG
jgi:two-component system sensor histidine kinase/response regulator